MKFIRILFLAVAVAGAGPVQQPAAIMQDSIGIDLSSGKVWFNEELTEPVQLSSRLESSRSVSLEAGWYSDESSDGNSDLLQPNGGVEAHPTVAAGGLLQVLDLLDQAGLNPSMVRISLYLEPSMKRNAYHQVELGEDGTVLLDGAKVAVEAIREKQAGGIPFFISTVKRAANADYRQLLSVLQAIGPQGKIAGLRFISPDRIEVEAVLYQLDADGKQQVISAPRVTTRPRNRAQVKVVSNGSGRRSYQPWMEDFHQEDLANLGVRFEVEPRIIGDSLKVTGCVILTKLIDRECVFMHEDIPVASYSCSKVVVPFSLVFPPGIESMEFDAADFDRRPTRCRITARVITGHGISRAQREALRRAGANHAADSN